MNTKLLSVLMLLTVGSVSPTNGFIAQNDTVYSATVSGQVPKLTATVAMGCDAAAAACASLVDLNKVQGMSKLQVNTSNAIDEHQAFAAGFLEGFLSFNQTMIYADNFFMLDLYPLLKLTPMYKFITTWEAWIGKQVSENGRRDPYWRSIGLSWNQLDGLVAGHNQAASAVRSHINTTMDRPMVILINSIAEMSDISTAVGFDETHPMWKQVAPYLDLIRERVPHCSALTKVVGAFAELYTSHVTWGTYLTMGARIWKDFRFGFSSLPSHERRVRFTSYPLTLYSMDDFYTSSAGIAVTETTLSMYNETMYHAIKPDQVVLTWLRAAVAIRTANSGLDWVHTFSKYNSGTYCNEWMVIDFNKFVPGTAIEENGLLVLEQIPSYIEWKDLSATLNQVKYWASYNVPYFETIYDRGGWREQWEKSNHSDVFSWSQCPRAQIFRKRQGQVADMQSMRDLMRYNDFQHDPLSHDNPMFAISSRGDLAKPAQAFGAIDAKITSAAKMKEMVFDSVCGPTADTQTPFQWSKSPVWYMPHLGQNDDMSFEWVVND